MSRSTPPEAPKPPARERILLAAHDLFYLDGIRATGIDRVIAESGVTKVTFYRHFPSKNDLICEFLEYRHRRWMAWFTDALQRHGGEDGPNIEALVPAMAEWFSLKTFRGCAFINAVAELGGTLPEVMEISRRHKQDVMSTIASLLPGTKGSGAAAAIAVALDGAIVRAQYEPTASTALQALDKTIRALLAAK